MALFRKRETTEESQEPERRRKTSDESFRVGRTLAGDAQKTREDKMARAADRRRRKIKDIATVAGVLLIIIVLVIVVVNYVSEVIREREAAMQPVVELEPTTAIYDENAGENISKRTKTFVARLESDVKEHGLELERVILPYQKVREIDVYIKDHSEYYKMSLDRSPAVQAEDMSRMVLYLGEKELKPNYVDLRVEGKAYYK